MTPDRPVGPGRPSRKTALREPDAAAGGDFSWPPPADDPAGCSIVMLDPEISLRSRPKTVARADHQAEFPDVDLDTALDAFADPPAAPATPAARPAVRPSLRATTAAQPPTARWRAVVLRSIVAVGIGASLALMPPPGASRMPEPRPGVVPAEPAAEPHAVAPRRARTSDRLRLATRFSAAAKRPDVARRDEDRIRTTLADLRAAYSQLDADAARRVWPSVDAAALARAFDGLQSQELRFDRCDVTVRGARARAACTGEAIYVPRIGDPAASTRVWTFELARRRERWTITSARAS